MLENTNDDELENELTLLEVRWKRNQRSYQKGMIARDEYETNNQQVNEALLAWISEW